jgi:hypothetical protein
MNKTDIIAKTLREMSPIPLEYASGIRATSSRMESANV